MDFHPVIAALQPFKMWAERYEPQHNDNLDEPVLDDWPLQNSLPPDALEVRHLRALQRICSDLERLTRKS